MNRISEITKRDIRELFCDGIDIEYYFDTKHITYPYYGRLSEIEFLNRLYDLKSLLSLDSRFLNAEEDILQHTVNNDDYPACWFFEDERFQLKNGRDEIYLKFICEIFHPSVRYEKGYWKEFLEEVNKLLQNDGYELYSATKISNHDVYDWRIFRQEENKMFVPFSQRNAKAIKEKNIQLSIKLDARNQIYQLLERYIVVYQETSDSGWQSHPSTSDKVFQDIRQFYIPKSYNEHKQYTETNDLQDFICRNSPYYLFDAIEFFEKYNPTNDFTAQINTILNLNGIAFRLENGRIVNTFDSQINNSSLAQVQEVGLKELLQEASKYYNEGNLSIAVEKLWDALERLKTYYSPTLDKKESVERIISDMSINQAPFKELFNKEFQELTTIGNDYRIRHHETTKTNIEDSRHYDYFYKRCLSLISISIRFLEHG